MTTGGLYDRYLANCTDGVVEPPDAFFERHPGMGAETRASIEAAPGHAIWLDDTHIALTGNTSDNYAIREIATLLK